MNAGPGGGRPVHAGVGVGPTIIKNAVSESCMNVCRTAPSHAGRETRPQQGLPHRYGRPREPMPDTVGDMQVRDRAVRILVGATRH
jgi:hypothetical protein